MKIGNTIISVIVIVIVFVALLFVFKLTYKDIPNPPLAIENKTYEELSYFTDKVTYQTLTCKDPNFIILIPPKYEMVTLMEKSTGKIYDLVNGKSKIEVRVMDLYGLTNVKTTPRKAYSYNLYSDLSMKQSYNEYVKSLKNTQSDELYVESGIKKLKGNMLVYYKSDDSNNTKANTTIRYNFMNDGYSIEVIGFINEQVKYQQIMNSLNNFSYAK